MPELAPLEAIAPVRVTAEPIARPIEARSAGFWQSPVVSRLRDLFAAHATAALDRAEDADRSIRRVIVEMEQALVDLRASAAATIADLKELDRVGQRLDRLANEWGERAELALARGRDDLARQALAERESARAMIAGLDDERSGLKASLAAQETDIGTLQARLAAARSRRTAIAVRMESAELRGRARIAANGERTRAAFAGLELLERRCDFAEGEAEALGMGSLEAEIESLRRDEVVERALQDLKAAQLARAA